MRLESRVDKLRDLETMLRDNPPQVVAERAVCFALLFI